MREVRDPYKPVGLPAIFRSLAISPLARLLALALIDFASVFVGIIRHNFHLFSEKKALLSFIYHATTIYQSLTSLAQISIE